MSIPLRIVMLLLLCAFAGCSGKEQPTPKTAGNADDQVWSAQARDAGQTAQDGAARPGQVSGGC